MRWRVVVTALGAAAFLLACEEPGEAGRADAASAADASGVPATGARERAAIESRGLAVGTLASVADAGYARALTARPFEFPADHGAHADFRTEWWYFTGNLLAEGGRRFGFQLTLFRLALTPPLATPTNAPAAARASRFATRQAWMGHFALSDVDGASEGQTVRDADRKAIRARDGRQEDQQEGHSGGGRFHAFERIERGAAGLAGAIAQPFRVWLRDWQVSAAGDAQNPGELFPLHLRAAESGISVNLRLDRGKALVLQGDAGLSRKSSAPGNASYYYSYTRLPASGRVRTADGEFQVTGLAWLDREWSSSALAPDQSGWDWFALHLSDGRDLMVYRLRNLHGDTHPYSAGMLVAADGGLTPLRVEQMHFEPGRIWRSPDGEQYPVAWKLRAGTLQLQVRALFDAQAHRGRFRYWEGAVQGSGRDGEIPLMAQGYLEMTGY